MNLITNDPLEAHRLGRLIKELEAALRRYGCHNPDHVAAMEELGYSNAEVYAGVRTDLISHRMACIAVEEMTGDAHARIPDVDFERIWKEKDSALIAAIPTLGRYILGYDRWGIARWKLPGEEPMQ